MPKLLNDARAKKYIDVSPTSPKGKRRRSEPCLQHD